MIEGFSYERAELDEVTINYARAGSGPPLLLLHGYPQTHMTWHRVAPRLAEDFTVVVPDLRGYGDSSKPLPVDDHSTYSKRAMAQDQVDLMSRLGFEGFRVAGHDRGARVSYRLALDHPDRVQKLAVLDIVPTAEMFAMMESRLALGVYHWLFLAQPYDLPERLIGADPEFWVRWHLRRWSGNRDVFFDPAAVDDYVRCFSDPEAIRASCEDYRAGASIDRVHDEVDREAGRKIGCPLLVLWGQREGAGSLFSHLDIWRRWASNVSGHAVDSGHFLPEEVPDIVTEELLALFR
ncbi:MAG: alpha/beta hydrolase [Dehalococcoidia bacterium]